VVKREWQIYKISTIYWSSKAVTKWIIVFKSDKQTRMKFAKSASITSCKCDTSFVVSKSVGRLIKL